MKNIIKILLVLLLFNSCKSQNVSTIESQRLKAANSDKKFAFIQIPNEDENRFSSENSFGDIFVYNLLDSTIIRYTDDNFYDVELSWSPDGKKLVFASSRDSYNSLTDDNGQAFMKISLYILDLTSGEIKQINRQRMPFRTIPSLTGLTWNNNGIYFANYENKIYKINESGDSFSVELELKEDVNITDLSFSYNGEYAIINYHLKNNFIDDYFYLYDLKTKNLIEIIASGRLAGWNKECNEFMFSIRDSVFTYNIFTKSIKYLPLQSNNDKLMVSSCFELDEDEIIQTSRENSFSKIYTRSIRDVDDKITIGIENLKNNNVWYPIPRDHYIRSFSPYSIQKYFNLFTVK